MSSFANFGIGIGALANGLAQGIEMGRTIKKIRKENAEEQARTDAFGAAKQAQEADIKTGANPGKSMMDYTVDVAIPQLRDHYLSVGDVDGATKLEAWAKDKKTQQGMSDFATGITALQSGDYDGGMKRLQSAYNNEAYSNDGISMTGYKVIKDDKGNVTGYDLTLKGQDGKSYNQHFANDDELMDQAMMFGNPAERFKEHRSKRAAEQALRLKLDEEDRADTRARGMEDYKQGNRERQATVQSNLKMDEDAAKSAGGGDDPHVKAAVAMTKYLKSLGWKQSRVEAYLPRIMGLERASQSPQDRMTSIIVELQKSRSESGEDPLPAQEAATQAKALMDAQDEILRQDSPSASAPQSAQGRGLPVRIPFKPGQGSGVPVWGPNGTYNVN